MSFMLRLRDACVIDLEANNPSRSLSSLMRCSPSGMVSSFIAANKASICSRSLARIRFLLSGLQQRLLSSIPAFARTLRRHLTTLQRHRDKADAAAGSDAAAALLAQGPPDLEPSDSEEDQDALLEAIQSEEDDIVESATGAAAGSLRNFDEAIARVEGMLEIAKQNERSPDARVAWLVDWINCNMLNGARSWNAPMFTLAEAAAPVFAKATGIRTSLVLTV
jgi:hypothetical protein